MLKSPAIRKCFAQFLQTTHEKKCHLLHELFSYSSRSFPESGAYNRCTAFRSPRFLCIAQAIRNQVPTNPSKCNSSAVHDLVSCTARVTGRQARRTSGFSSRDTTKSALSAPSLWTFAGTCCNLLQKILCWKASFHLLCISSPSGKTQKRTSSKLSHTY